MTARRDRASDSDAGSAPDSHTAAVAAARQALVDELGLAETDLARSFLAAPAGPRVRAAAVRSALARHAADEVAAALPGFAFGRWIEPSDEVLVHLPARLAVREGLSLPVLGELPLKFLPFVVDVACRGPAAVAAELARREPPGLREAARRLRAAPPRYAGWELLAPADLDRVFAARPPLLSDRQELYHRLRLACAHAVDRAVLDGLAVQHPGFLDYLQCFPVARSLVRKVVAWLGPTNSGKTHRALHALAAAPSGQYLGPLRLLALEQSDRLAELGTPCSLITGEERIHRSDTHSARTVEMADFSRPYAVCVLDEMQLAFDRDRGWAWVAAYCGLAAETLVVTGPLSAEPVVRRLAGLCGDTVEVHHLERQGRLVCEGVLDWRRLPPRTAVIGFSRALVLELKALFESLGQRVAVIYGGLSPEVRRHEARRFRAGEADLVCATDAIGLGLNLPLDRVVFYETDKFDGRSDRPLSAGELLQIAGRAGRGPGATGWVGALSERDARRVAAALAEPQATPAPDRLPAAPTTMHIRAIADRLGLDRLTAVLEFFRTRLSFSDGVFFPEVQEDVFAAAELVDSVAPGLPIEQRHALACAPVDLDDAYFRSVFADWVHRLADGEPVLFARRLDSSGGLESLEETLKLVTAYRWLALKFPDAFTDLAHVDRLRRDATEQTQAILRRNWGRHGLARRECRRCGRALLPSSPYRTCRACGP